MKTLLILASLAITATAVQAQSDCDKNHPVYKVDISGTPRTVYTLGTDPEFPFLRNLSTPEQVVAAMNSNANKKKYPRQMKELNKMLVQIGFANGTKDVQPANVSAYSIAPGTTGNMGNGHFKYSYIALDGGKAKKAWKIANGDLCYIAFLNTCGNAFYPSGVENATTYTGNKPKCENVEVNINADPKEVTISDPAYAKKKTYIFYKKGCPCRDCGPGWSENGYKEGILSRPLLVKTEKTAIPQTYKVTANNTGNALICKGKTTEVTAGLVVEKENEYTGYLPEVKKEYIEVTRHEYMRTLRQKRLNEQLMERPATEKCSTCD